MRNPTNQDTITKTTSKPWRSSYGTRSRKKHPLATSSISFPFSHLDEPATKDVAKNTEEIKKIVIFLDPIIGPDGLDGSLHPHLTQDKSQRAQSIWCCHSTKDFGPMRHTIRKTPNNMDWTCRLHTDSVRPNVNRKLMKTPVLDGTDSFAPIGCQMACSS